MKPLILLAGLLALGGTGPAIPAAAQQAASSPTFFLAGFEVGSGENAASSTFRLNATVGSGAPAEFSNSTGFRLLGGLNAALDVPVTGRPWVTGVLPRFGPFLGGTSHTVHGTELALGTATNVQVDGLAASVSGRSADQVTISLPTQSVPGWRPVQVTNSGGTSVLPRAIGILPMADKPHAIEVGRPFRITYRGTKGDIFYLAVATGKLPFAFPVPPYHHGLEFNPASLIDVVGPFPVFDASGEFHLDFPGIPFPRPLYVQMLGLPTGNPGYAPGCFTNLLEL